MTDLHTLSDSQRHYSNTQELACFDTMTTTADKYFMDCNLSICLGKLQESIKMLMPSWFWTASVTGFTPITVYTIYFHPQQTVPTASEKDNMVISYLTLNIISIKTVSSIAVSLTLGDYCFLYTIYHIQSYTLPLPSTQLKLVSSFLYTILLYVSCVCYVLVYYSQNITMTLFTVLLFFACCFICRLYLRMDFFSFYTRPYVFTFYVTVCECHIALKATWLDLTWLGFSYVIYISFSHEHDSDEPSSGAFCQQRSRGSQLVYDCCCWSHTYLHSWLTELT